MRESVAAHPHFALRPGLFVPKGAGGAPFRLRERKKQWTLVEKPTVFGQKQPTFSAASTTFAPTAPRLGAKKRTAEQKK